MLERVANAVLFQIGWLTCVLGGNSLWLLVALAVLVIHLRVGAALQKRQNRRQHQCSGHGQFA